MKTILSSILFCGLLLAACNTTTPVSPVQTPLTKSKAGARTLATEITGQWKLTFIYSSAAPYDLSTYSTGLGCSSSNVWLYISPTDNTWTLSNQALCYHTWSGLLTDFNNQYMGFETWNSFSAEIQQYSVSPIYPGYVTFGRAMAGQTGMGKGYDVTVAADGNSMTWNVAGMSGSNYYYIMWQRATGGPSIP